MFDEETKDLAYEVCFPFQTSQVQLKREITLTRLGVHKAFTIVCFLLLLIFIFQYKIYIFVKEHITYSKQLGNVSFLHLEL